MGEGMLNGRVAFEADYVRERVVAVSEDSWERRRGLLYDEQSCTLDFHAVGVPCPCGRPNLRAGLGALWVGPTLRKGPFEGEEGHFAVSETRRQGRLVLRGH